MRRVRAIARVLTRNNRISSPISTGLTRTIRGFWRQSDFHDENHMRVSRDDYAPPPLSLFSLSLSRARRRLIGGIHSREGVTVLMDFPSHVSLNARISEKINAP